MSCCDEENSTVESEEDISRSPQPFTRVIHSFRYPTVTSQGLPPPSAHQLLQPFLSSAIFPFPRYFTRIYSLLQTLHNYSSMARELSLTLYVTEDNNTCVKSEADNSKALFLAKFSEYKVKTAARELSTLLPEMLSASPESLDLILPYVRELLEEPKTSVLAAWHLFDPIAKVLGPQKTAATLLEPIVKLYDNDTSDDTDLPPSDTGNRRVKLYHRSFLLQLIVRLGLRVFLDYFTAPLVEAVGGYRDLTQSEHNQHHHRSEFWNKASHLKYVAYISISLSLQSCNRIDHGLFLN
jgi:WD repeat-containing protein 81